MSTREKIGLKIKGRREAMKLTRYALCKGAGITRDQLIGIEDAVNNYQIDTLIKVCTYLNYKFIPL